MLRIKDLTFDAWGRRFFDQATVSLPKDAKVGLVGRNGVGKSTLFKLILNQLVLGSGEINLPRAARIGSVDFLGATSQVTLVLPAMGDTAVRASLPTTECLGLAAGDRVKLAFSLDNLTLLH